ncbi:aminoacetone oxidase family FAD-binding enzyme [Clostridium sp. MCC353]|uniref:NAD(P)/FAD-dependent oxidoreductase n=1 Tax=Clostridium sp. MCC353 TaxID=2592646 RepID=UPI001C019D9F|nr:NAD(P)/FAD-dependent oxidoreductase [Clostridium sp. MCC353]MBT9779606.1 aminoacetone oxidase family FAD-binding enzyme [Clostridium sp. MCC353]
MKRTVMIAGGGASGLTAAIWAARTGAKVTVLEHMDRVGKKILSTGNGRCNLTNLYMEKECYRCGQPEFPMDVIRGFDVKATLDFFRELGILPKDRQGYVYPNSDQAASVLDVLRSENVHRNVEMICGCDVKRIKKTRAGFELITSAGNYKPDAVILAAGSKAAPSTGSDGSGYELAAGLGHRIIKPLPALVQLRCEGKFFKQLTGVRTDAELCLLADGKPLARDRGELQLTDYGISGIPTFQISRFASVALDRKKKVSVSIDFLPDMSLDETWEFLKARIRRMHYKRCDELLTGVLNKKLAAVLLKQAGINGDGAVSSISPDQVKSLTGQIKKFVVKVSAVNPYENAQVCCGGVDTAEIVSSTMESKLVKGLYIAGELLDVDGICGGYNLQFAWSSGALAGIHAAKGN